MNIVILGCGYIANRVAQGIQFSKANLYGIASRDKEKAKVFAQKYRIEHVLSYEECMNDSNVDLVYIATINPMHYELTKLSLTHHKHVICEKPFVSSTKEVKELFELARKNQCFLMEAHKTCFTPLNQYLKSRISEIGEIKEIQASFITPLNPNLKDWNIDDQMGGSFYDLGVYPLCFSNFYANNQIVKSTFEIQMYENDLCDSECTCLLTYKNGIHAKLLSSWNGEGVNKGVGLIIGSKGMIEIPDFWKSTEAKITINGIEEIIKVEQKSDFTGEINHACECVQKGLLESPVMSEKAMCQIADVLEEMKKNRNLLRE